MHMSEEDTNQPAQRLGARLRHEREQLGLSTHALAQQVGINQATVSRIEQGAFTNPDPVKVAAIARNLGLDVAEIMALTQYPLSPDALSPTLYLRAKYHDLPPGQLSALQREVAQVLHRHGIEANEGPAPGEDERPDPTPSTNLKKGGTP